MKKITTSLVTSCTRTALVASFQALQISYDDMTGDVTDKVKSLPETKSEISFYTETDDKDRAPP